MMAGRRMACGGLPDRDGNAVMYRKTGSCHARVAYSWVIY